MCAEPNLSLEENGLTSRRVFLPPPQAPRRIEFYRDLLAALGLNKHAYNLALRHLDLAEGQSVLHAGCGDGRLTLAVKERWPGVEIAGIGPDEKALEAAGEAAEEAGLHVLFQKGYLQDLPDTAERYDQLLCVLFLHRLRGAERGGAFAEFLRVLKPGGRVLLVDFGAARGGLRGWLVGRLARHLPGIADQQKLGLAELCKLGGLAKVKMLGEGPFGLRAVRGEKTFS